MSNNITLSYLCNESKELFLNWSNNPKISELLFSPLGYSVEDVERMINSTPRSSCNTLVFIINHSVSARSVGYVTARQIQGNSKNSPPIFEIGILIGEEWRNNGVGRVSIIALCNKLFSEYKCNRIQAMIDPDNMPSRKAFENSGFVLEGVLREYTFRGGAFRSECIYSLLRNDNSV